MKNLIPFIDSRKLGVPSQSIFFAIVGEHHNGHRFVDELYKKGVRHFVVSHKDFSIAKYPLAKFKTVKDTLSAFQDYAAQHRKTFKNPIVAITGSNGKTIVKEWLSQMLEHKEVVCKSPRSFNSQVGVPLSVMQLKPHHSIGIFEAGISTKGEMDKLRKILRPDVGIFTNIGTAHSEGFASLKEKIKEKLILFKDVKWLIYHKENDELSKAIAASGIKTLSWSFGKGDISVKALKQELILSYKRKNYNIKHHFVDKASIENLMHCIAFMLYKGYDEKTIRSAVSALKPVSMRLEIKKGINDCYIIDDSYNNDLGGLQTAIDFFELNKQHPDRTVILSDILQSGLEKKELYKQVNQILKSGKVKRLIGIGNDMVKYQSHFAVAEKHFYKTVDDFLNSAEHFSSEVILIKGARPFKFERITEKLSAKTHRTALEINLDALQHNLNCYRAKLHPKTKIMVMVKAFAYGGGSEQIAHFLQYNKVDYLAVAYTDEGVALRKNGITLPIMVMNPSVDDFQNIFDYKLEPEIYNADLLEEWTQFSKGKSGIPALHIKIDTGMHRLGFDENQISELIKKLKSSRLKVASVYSHLAAADDISKMAFTEKQIKQFRKITKQMETQTGKKFLKHILNSSGLISCPDAQFDMVRLGIGLYGFDPTGIIQKELKSVTSLYSSISQIKNIKKGSSVGYGADVIARKDMRVATVGIGYADGYSRLFSNGNGVVFINSKRAKVFGKVCMDMMMVDVGGIVCDVGDKVEIFGSNISIVELALKIKTIPYEILTNVSERVKRVYYRE